METGRAVALGLCVTFALALAADAGLTAGERGGKLPKVKPLVLVINYPYQITGSAKTKIHVTMYKPDFSPAAGAEVSVNGKEVGKADENGTCVFDYVPGNSRGHTLRAKLPEGAVTYRATKTFACNSRTASFRSDQLYVYTDRGVYNPGDEVLVRLLAWELLADYAALPDAQVSLLLQSREGKVYAGEKLKTNEYGVAAARLPLSQSMPEGDYELVVLYNQARETARLRVERFVPPVIEIKHDLKRFLTPAQDRLDVEVSLSYFAGGKPRAASLDMAVLDAAGAGIFRKTFAETSEALFRFALDKSELDGIRGKLTAEQPFKIELLASDKYGRSSKVTRDVVFTQRPYQAVLELDKDDYPPGETVKLQAKVTDLDGKPARGISLTCAVDQFNVKVTALTDASGVAEFSFPMGKTSGVAVVTSPVMPVPLASREIRLNTPKPMTSKVSEPPHKQGIQTHFNVTFDPEYAPVERVVHVDFTDLSGALVTSTTIPVTKTDKGGWEAKGTVTAPTWGTMLANLYVAAVRKTVLEKKMKLSVRNVGFITEGQHVTLYPDAEATITVTGLKPRVKPGEKATFRVEVKTKSGEDAAVGASLVDNAVVSLMDPLEVTPSDHFYNPQRKVISSGGAGVLTWPVVDRNWGTPWRDIAYSNWGFKDPGAMVSGGEGVDQLEGGAGDATVSGAAGYGAGGEGVGSGGLILGELSKGKVAPKVKSAKMMLMSVADSVAPAPPMAEAEMAKEEDGDDEAPAGGPAADRERGRRGEGKKASAPPKITIRTRFPETALWEPLLKTKAGAVDLSVTFPDAITVQKLTLVASDRKGGLGLLRQDVEVRQDLYIQSDFPATLTLGDEVQLAALVRNLSGREVALTVEAGSSGLEFTTPTKLAYRLADGESLPVTWKGLAGFCGKVEYTIAVEGEGFRDEERKSVFVLPAGAAVTRLEKGTVAAGAPFSAQVELDPDAVWRTVFLNVSFPNVIPGIQAWQAMEELPLRLVGVSGVASRAILDAALLSWGSSNGMPRARVDQLRARLSRAAADLVAAQNADGSWGWYYLPDASLPRGGYQVSVYLSAYVLKALSAITAADLMLSDEAMRKGVEFILKSRNKDGLWSDTGAYFWEFNAPETDMALSAELFDILVQAVSVRSDKPNMEVGKVKVLIEKYLDSQPQEPAGVAHAVSGLLHWARWTGEKGLEKKLAAAVDGLLRLKRTGYWEPHWYHAYGGMVELNAIILELLRQFGGRYDAVEHELVAWLLSTREAWGAWHNEIGTANAVRALLAAGAGAVEEVPSTVRVFVNDAEIASVAIDPADVFLSAARLRFVDLTPYLRPGANEITVSYDGRLEAPVVVESRQWGVDQPAAAPAGKPVLAVLRTAPDRADAGAPVEVEIDVRAERPLRHVQVADAIPSNMEADTASLDELARAGAIACYTVRDGTVALILPELKNHAVLKYRLTAVRPGRGEHRGVEVSARYRSDIPAATFFGTEIIVSN